MADHKLNVGDETQADANIAGPQAPTVERKQYEVTAEGGLFKNGKQYKTGQKVELDSNTATRFIEAGEVKEAK